MPTTTERGYGWQWQQLRRQALRLYGDLCHLCGRPGATTLDHLDPLSVHGVHLPTLDRVRPAHRACNSRRGRKPLVATRHSRAW